MARTTKLFSSQTFQVFGGYTAIALKNAIYEGLQS